MVSGPLAECCCAIQVAIVTECCIGHEPLGISIKECLELLALEHSCTLLGKQFLEVAAFCLVDAFIVDLVEGVEFLAQVLVVLCALLVGQGGQLTQVGILGMQCIDADAVVWIAVAPCAGDCAVVDGEHLQCALACSSHPVDHCLEVAKVAHAIAALATQREDGYHGAGYTQWRQWEVGLAEFIHYNIARAH